MAVLGLALFITINMLMVQADAGDQLGFLGAVLGAGITVAGSVFAVEAVENGKRRRERTDRRMLLLELIGEVLNNIDRVEEVLDKPEGTLGLAAAATENLNRKIRVLQDARQWIVPDNAAMVRAFGYIGAIGAVSRHSNFATGSQKSAAVTAISRELGSARTWARAARRELQR